MQLLDAAFTFALTLAALATVVTILMETFHRAWKVRKRNLIRVLVQLNRELTWLPEGERWAFAREVLSNPAVAEGKMLADPMPQAMPGNTCEKSLLAMGWLQRRRDIYDTVSMEHVLRRLTETATARQMLQSNAERFRAELDRISRCYQVICASISADFKRRAQMWSMLVGVLVAVGCNLDGIRIFEAYMNDSLLRERVIARQDRFEAAADAAQQRVEAPEGAEPSVSLTELEALGIPIGPSYWPWGDRDRPKGAGYPDCLVWLAKVVFSGLLIGLGAPFWFDVAKRLAEVRQAFGGAASTEARASGQDPVGDREERQTLLATVIEDATADTAMQVTTPLVMEVQRKLNRWHEARGQPPLAADGVLGMKTTRAIGDFLSSHMAPEDSKAILGDETSPDYFYALLGLLDDALSAEASSG